jgi:hypothetical protein
MMSFALNDCVKGDNSSNGLQADLANGFTEVEVNATQRPIPYEWTPPAVYEEKSIRFLNLGPARVTLSGRIVNFHRQPNQDKTDKAAKGFFKVLLSDGTALLMVISMVTTIRSRTSLVQKVFTNDVQKVKLWYARTQYKLRLGQFVSTWTTHISNAGSLSLTASGASLSTNIFPERNKTCNFKIHDESSSSALCRTPLGYGKGDHPLTLMTLESFVKGGYEVAGGEILVCVKSIGDRKRCR